MLRLQRCTPPRQVAFQLWVHMGCYHQRGPLPIGFASLVVLWCMFNHLQARRWALPCGALRQWAASQHPSMPGRTHTEAAGSDHLQVEYMALPIAKVLPAWCTVAQQGCRQSLPQKVAAVLKRAEAQRSAVAWQLSCCTCRLQYLHESATLQARTLTAAAGNTRHQSACLTHLGPSCTSV